MSPFLRAVGIEEVVEFFEAFVSESEDIKTGVPARTSQVQKFRMSPFLSDRTTDLFLIVH